MKYTYDYHIKAIIPENKNIDRIFLSPTESIIFEELIKNKYVSREKLTEMIYASNDIKEYKKLLYTHISRLNKKLKYYEKIILYNHTSYGLYTQKK